MPPQTPPHPHDAQERHRRRVTLIATVSVLVLIAVMVWVVQWFVEQQRIERCLANRRPDCFRIDAPPREGPAQLPPKNAE